MKDLHYKLFSFRLNDKTVENIKTIKHDTGETYNMLFVAFIDCYKKFGKFEKKSKKVIKKRKPDLS
jgi:hypothetical protein